MNEIRQEDGHSVLVVNHKGQKFDVNVEDEDVRALVEFGYNWYYHNGWIRATKQVGRKRKNVLLHRFLMNPPDDMVVDHIDRNPLNNLRSNLRIITATENRHNSGANRGSATGIRGVTWHKRSGKYMGRVRMGGKAVFQAYFDRIEEAEEAVKEARRKFMPKSTD